VLGCACSKPTAKREPASEDESEEADEPPKKKKTKASSTGLVFEPAPSPIPGAPSPRPQLTFEPAPQAPAPATLPPEYDFLSSGASRIVPLMESRVANPRFASVVVRHERVDLEVITGSDAVHDYQLKGDSVIDRGPDKPLIRRGKELQRSAFSSADVDWAKLPGVVKDALKRIPGAQLSHVHIDRPLPFSQDVQVRVFTERRGWVDYDARGAFREVTLER
jgi:hypothetical protein